MKKDQDYTVIFQKEPEGGYTVLVPALSGCVTYGETLEEAQIMAKEAIELYLESLKDHDEDIPTQEDVLYGQIHVNISL